MHLVILSSLAPVILASSPPYVCGEDHCERFPCVINARGAPAGSTLCSRNGRNEYCISSGHDGLTSMYGSCGAYLEFDPVIMGCNWPGKADMSKCKYGDEDFVPEETTVTDAIVESTSTTSAPTTTTSADITTTTTTTAGTTTTTAATTTTTTTTTPLTTTTTTTATTFIGTTTTPFETLEEIVTDHEGWLTDTHTDYTTDGPVTEYTTDDPATEYTTDDAEFTTDEGSADGDFGSGETTGIATTVSTSSVENQECDFFRAKAMNSMDFGLPSDNKCLTLPLSHFMDGCDPLTGTCDMINHPRMKDCKEESLNQQLIHNTTTGQITTMKGSGKCLSVLAYDQATWELNYDPCEEHSDEYMTGSYVYFFECQAEAVPWQRFTFDGVYLRSGCPHNYALADAFPFISAENPDDKLDSTTFLQLEKQCL